MSDFALEIDRILLDLRELAESLMVDTCTIERPSGDTTTDPNTGAVTPAAPAQLYSGPCRFQIRSSAEERTDSGEQRFRLSSSVVKLPISATKYADGDLVTWVTSRHDPAGPGRHFRVVAVEEKSHATERRLNVEEGV